MGNNKLRVIFFSHSASMGGAERSLLHLITDIRKEVECLVILPKEGDFVQELNKIGVEYLIFQYKHWTVKRPTPRSNPEHTFAAHIMSAELMLDSLSKFKPNLIYTNTSVICEGAIVAYKLRVPHIWHVHEIGEKSLNSIYDYGIAFTSKFINDFSSHVIFNSKVTENYFSKYIKKEKSSVVYNSILLNQNPEASVSERVFTKENSHKLLTAGIISAKKNQFDVIKAINILVKNGYNVELAIFGNCHDPILLSKIQNYILNNNLSEAIHIHSFVNNPYPYFKQTNIVVVPSINDSFGRTILEGMIFNKPVIAASSGGSKEIIVDGVNGYLYKPHKHTELASKIIKLMTDSYIRDLFINNGKETANKFTELNYSRTIYEKLTSNLTIPSIDSRYKRLIFKEL